MALADRVHVAGRYRRAIRLEADLGDASALEGFICSRSSADVLESLARHVLETDQCAFTWTGPYGGGKSSLAVALGNLLGGSPKLRQAAAAILGKATAELLHKALPPRSRGWRILPITGRRDSPVRVIGEAIEVAGWLPAGETAPAWSEKRVLDALTGIAALNPRAGGGLVVFIDEMGKFLEAAARDGTDIHLFQQLAELASRSDRRLLVIGILHQAFDEYGYHLLREQRDEWAKIQGRFVDLAINSSRGEQIDLIGRAIRSENGRKTPQCLAKGVAQLMQGATPDLVAALENCWPLHPVTACLLGPLSRRRFGQNQRSLFAFLNSAEPGGFRDFLGRADEKELYGPDRLWDYLRINLEPSILVSPDSHRWALAVDALGRCAAMSGEELHERLLKVIALADLLKERSGLPPRRALLGLALPGQRAAAIDAALEALRSQSLIVFRRFSDAWAVFEGSDFDIDEAVAHALQEIEGSGLGAIDSSASLQSLVAKRHYHETGALRWYDVTVSPLAHIEAAATAPRCNGAIGRFVLALPMQAESIASARRLCRKASKQASDRDTVIGLSPGAWGIPGETKELAALERVRDDSAQLHGDRVARTEVLARVAALRERIESDVARSFETSTWYHDGTKIAPLTRAALNGFASTLADRRYCSAPRLRNELLARTRPSSNAIAARNILLRRMVSHETEERLGIQGFPAEGGLYVSLLEKTKLHRETAEGWGFRVPEPGDDPCGLAPLWERAMDHLRANAERAVSIAEIHDAWRRAPYGVKDGLLPVLSVAFMLSERNHIAVYREGLFQPAPSELDADILAREPADIQVRWMDLTGVSRCLLSELADVVRDLDDTNTLRDLEPIDVAKGLVAIHDRLPPWVGRTQRLTRDAIRIRRLLRNANDPNRLLFNDIPALLGDAGGLDGAELHRAQRVTQYVRTGLAELSDAYPAMLGRLREILLSELQVPNASPTMLDDLRARAENVRELGGDHRLEAFIVRLARFDDSDDAIEGLAGMAVNRPIHAWSDPDIDRAAVELANMARRFVHVEAFARVKGRKAKRHAISVIVGIDGQPTPVHGEFQIADRDAKSVTSVVQRMDAVLRQSDEPRREIVLAALAELSARYLRTGTTPARRRTHKRTRRTSR